LVCVCAVPLAVAAASALGYTGTVAGKKLAGQLLRAYDHVHYLAGSVHGSVYYCPQEVGGYDELISGTPPPSCAGHPAKASWVNTLSRGKGVGAVGTVAAQGKPTITFVAKKSNTFIRSKGAHCWTKQYTDYSFVGYPPFAFFPKEYMTAGAKRHNRIKLIGKMSSFGGFMETDTVNATSHQMIGESIYFGHDHPKTQSHLITSYHQEHGAPSVPRTSPVC
jgi:hypothetical protein